MAERPTTDPALREVYAVLMREAGDLGHLDEATWDRLAAGEVDPAGRDAAFDHVVSCERCATIWKGVLALQEESRAAGLSPRERGASPAWQGASFRLAIAATLVVVIGAIVMRTSAPDQAPGTSPAPAPAPPVVPSFLAAFPITKADIHVTPEEALAPRGTAAATGEPPIERLAIALEPYRRDDFEEAAARLAALAKDYPAAGRPALYWGVSLLHLDRAPEALAPLRAASASAHTAVAADARWYYAVALARSNQPAAALAEVRSLCAANGTHAARACEAQKALEIIPR